MKIRFDKLSILFILIILLGLVSNISFANEEFSKDIVYFFWGDGCPHCTLQKNFLDEMKEKYPNIDIKSYETWKNPDNAKLFQEIAEKYNTNARGVPSTFIGDKFWVGFSDSMKPEMELKIKEIAEKKDIENINIKEDDNKKELCIHVFLDYSCSECDQTKSFMDSLDLDDIEIIYHNINEEEEKKIYDSFKIIYGLKSAGYPSLFIGDRYLIGLDSIKNNIFKTIQECKTKECPCPSYQIKGITSSIPKDDFKPESPEAINIPFVGEINIDKMPLVLMTALIAFVDGFNPCSLWVLTFLLGIVIYTGSRKKILIVGLTFLTVTSIAYGFFMLGLLNVFTYIGYTTWIKIGVSLIAGIFAIVNIKDYFWYKKGISFTISDRHKPKLFKKIRNIMDPNKSTVSMIIATALMALGIVLVELPCTAGFPMIWTNMISHHEVSGMMFALLFLLYMLIYLIDELVVFTGVVLTLKASRFEEKHGRVLKLIGGMIMLALSFALIFIPEIMNSIKGSVYIFGSAILLSMIILFIHRRILPKYGINIGTEKIEEKTKKKN